MYDLLKVWRPTSLASISYTTRIPLYDLQRTNSWWWMNLRRVLLPFNTTKNLSQCRSWWSRIMALQAWTRELSEHEECYFYRCFVWISWLEGRFMESVWTLCWRGTGEGVSKGVAIPADKSCTWTPTHGSYESYASWEYWRKEVCLCLCGWLLTIHMGIVNIREVRYV